MCTKPSRKKIKKVLLKGEPGIGKTTLAKKMALDWARGVFTTFSIVLFVILKLAHPGDAIENVIIKQNYFLEGLGVTQCKLEAILNTFGGKCLLILDGLDEHALGENEDVLKIIRGQKLLNCNIVVTSRPHSITSVKKYFDVIAVVEGFTEKQARQFTSKILSDEKQIDAVMSFDPYRISLLRWRQHEILSDIDTFSKPVYNCPILVSFLCILIQDNQIDLSGATLSFGEIYSRMIRCLYTKYIRRQGLEFCLNEFIKVLKALGKLAFESLLTGNYLLKRSEVITEVGPDAFDYGLLIGHEDAEKLKRDETADIYVTFPHRTIQEFLGALFFVLSLNEGISIENLLGADSTKPIFMVNPLFLHFCTWLIFSSKEIFQFEILTEALESMKLSASKLINFSQLDISSLARLFPAIDIDRAYHREDTSNLSFFRELLSACDNVRHIILKSKECANLMSESVNFMPRSVSIISFGDSRVAIPCNERDEITLAIHGLDFPASEKDIIEILQNIISKLENLRVIRVFWFPKHQTFTFPQLIKKSVKEIHITRPVRDVLSSFPDIDCCPSLTHLSLSGMSPVAQVRLRKALREGNLCNLTNLCIMHTNLCDNKVINVVPACRQLTSLNLSYSTLSVSGCQVIASLSNRLTSLVITPNLVTLCLQGTWQNLTNVSFLGTSRDFYEFFDVPFTLRSRLRNMYRRKTAQKVSEIIHVINPEAMPLVSRILITGFIVSKSDLGNFTEKIVRWKISKLDISHSFSITGNLDILLDQTLPYLNSLILYDCGLNAKDLRSLTKASLEGRLPGLKHLDISVNDNLDIRRLFQNGSTWSQLKGLSISLVDEISDYKWLARSVELGCLSSLEQLRLWIHDDNLSSSDTTWTHIEKIEIFILNFHRNVRTVISQIDDMYQKDHLPALRTVSVMTCQYVVGNVTNEACRLRQHNINVHAGSIADQMFLSKVGLL